MGPAGSFVWLVVLSLFFTMSASQISVGFDVEIFNNSTDHPSYSTIKACLDPEFVSSFQQFGYACERLNCTLGGTMFFSLKESGTVLTSQLDGDGCAYATRIPSSAKIIIKAIASIRGPATTHTNALSMDFGSHMDPQGRYFYVARPGAGVRALTSISAPLFSVKNISECSMHCSSDALEESCCGYVYRKVDVQNASTVGSAGTCTFFTDGLASPLELLSNDVEVHTKMSYQQLICGPTQYETDPPWEFYVPAAVLAIVLGVSVFVTPPCKRVKYQ